MFTPLLLFFPGVCSRPSSWDINLGSNGTLYGDMILTPRQLSRYAHSGQTVRHTYRKESSFNRWTNNIVPYTLSNRYSSSQFVCSTLSQHRLLYRVNLLRTSLKSLEQYSCFRFVERRSERDYLYIDRLDGCYSYVGRTGGRQLLSLATDCLADYIIFHEIMHALGFEHEHQRPDRDSFIKVEYRNVQPGQMVNFEKVLPNEIDYPDRYDYKSIMHYDGFAFGKIESGRRLATMIPLRKDVALLDNMQLSSTDIAKLNRLGKCSNGASQSECKDNPMVNCRQMIAQCGIESYRQVMDSQCPMTCGRCVQRRECADLDSRCSMFASNGFCTNVHYGDEPRIRCPRTCGLC